MGEHRLTRIATRTGDDGQTGLADGSRLPKTHPRVAALGEVDELNACIGLLAVEPSLDDTLRQRLRVVQHELFDLGGELSLPGATVLDRGALATLEADLAGWNAALPPLREFVLPGASEADARAHLARTACRRAERALWALHAAEPGRLDEALPRYLNRLADWLFVLGRQLARRDGGHEFTWQRDRRPPL